MIDKLKELLSEATVNITTDVNKIEITFSFKGTDVTSKDPKVSSEETPKKVVEEVKQETVQEPETPKEEVKPEVVEEPVVQQKEEPKLEEPQRSERTLERIKELESLGYTEKPDEKQFVRGGVGLSTSYIEKATDEEFERGLMQIREMIEKNKSNNEGSKVVDPVPEPKIEPESSDKPKKSFSEFQAEKIEFEEPKETPKEEVKEELKQEAAPVQTSIPMPQQPLPKATTLEEDIEALKIKAQNAGYDPSTIQTEGATKESIAQLSKYIDENPLK